MTFAEKLKRARKEAGLSQEQFAEKISVSRSAVAKWEAGKGMPDIQNLKVMAQLLNVSLDFLLDEDKKILLNEIKEPIDLNDYEKHGKCRNKRDAVCLAKFGDAQAIYPLIHRKKMSKGEWVTDLIVGPGIVQVLDYLNESASYYLVEKNGKQLFVKVTTDFITVSEPASRLDSQKFDIGRYTFRKATYRLI